MTSRRDFARITSVAALATVLSPGAATAQQSESRDNTAMARARARAAVLASEFPSLPRPVVEETAVKDLADYLPYLDRLQSVPLTNADEPDFIFSAVTQP